MKPSSGGGLGGVQRARGGEGRQYRRGSLTRHRERGEGIRTGRGEESPAQVWNRCITAEERHNSGVSAAGSARLKLR